MPLVVAKVVEKIICRQVVLPPSDNYLPHRNHQAFFFAANALHSELKGFAANKMRRVTRIVTANSQLSLRPKNDLSFYTKFTTLV